MRVGDRTNDPDHPDFGRRDDLVDLLAAEETALVAHSTSHRTEQGVLISDEPPPSAVLRTFAGTADTLLVPIIDERDPELFVGNILSHSHVGSEPLSVDDVLYAIRHDLAEHRAVGKDHTYSIKPLLGGWPADLFEEVATMLLDLYEEAGNRDNARNRASRRTYENLARWREDLHEAVAEVSRRYRVAYTRAEAPGEPPNF